MEHMKYTLAHMQIHTDIHEHLINLHAHVTQTGAKLVLELGVRSGESTVALVEAVHYTLGKVISVDVGVQPDVLERLKRYGLAERWESYQCDDIEFGTKIWDRNKLFDVIFIDTSHEYHHTTKEIATFEPLLKPGGRMLFHDTVSHPDGVLRPILEFVAAHPDYHFHNAANCNGLGTLTKPGTLVV